MYILDVIVLYDPKFTILYSENLIRGISSILSNHRLHYKHTPIMHSGMPWTVFAIGTFLAFAHDKKDTYHWNPQGRTSVTQLLNSGYKYDKSTHLIIPQNYVVNADSGVYKQLAKFKNSKDIYVRVSKDMAERLSNLKTHCTKTLNLQKQIYLVKNFPMSPVSGIIDTEAMKTELKLMNKNTTNESVTYGFMNMLLTYYFNTDDGYIVAPQSKETSGEADFVVKKDGYVVCVVESKALDAKNYPFTHLYAQAVEYANTNHGYENVFVIVNKGDYISFGMYVPDFHSSNNFKMKSTLFDGYIGLQVNSNLRVKPVPQLNVFEPQHKLYRAGHGIEQNKSIYTLLDYVKKKTIKGIDPRILDFRPHVIDDSGGLFLNRGRIRILDFGTNKIEDTRGIGFDTGKARFVVDSNGITYDKHSY